MPIVAIACAKECMLDVKAVAAGLRLAVRGLNDAIAGIEGTSHPDDGVHRRETELLREFDRPPGAGLTQEEASRACKRHGFTPQTVGAWALRGWLVTSTEDGLRYLTAAGKTRLANGTTGQ